jgi:EAL domain-containing protein (putative c-di-GMP-specific phosphodiesterase class I)
VLVELGCDKLQGYLFARPMPATQLGAAYLTPLPTAAAA